MVEVGQKVRVWYTGTLDDGTVFDSNRKKDEPMEFVVGNRKLLAGFEKAVLNMNPGDVVTIHIPAAEAYGTYDEALIIDVPAENIPHANTLDAGRTIMIGAPSGPIQAKVVEADFDFVKLDLNHPLADKDLTFEIELVEIVTQNAIEREMHGSGCACGCDKLKEALTAQNAAAAK